jgi:hypothetical protein
MKTKHANFIVASLSAQATFWIALLPLLSVLQANPFFSGSYFVDSLGLTSTCDIVRGTSSATSGLSLMRDQCVLFNRYLEVGDVIYPSWVTFGEPAVCAETWAQVLTADNLASWLPLACSSALCAILCAIRSVLRDDDSRKSISTNTVLLASTVATGVWTCWRLTAALPFSGLPIGLAFFVLLVLYATTYPHLPSFLWRRSARALSVPIL